MIIFGFKAKSIQQWVIHMQLQLEGKRALVTGASSGLGPVIARALDNAGVSIVIHCNSNLEAANALAEELTQPALVAGADLSDPAEVRALFNAAVAAGPIDILVNCAAAESQDVSDLNDLPLERWQHTQQVNVEAPLLLTQLFAGQGQAGAIVNISSIEGSRTAPMHGHYATSKAALEMLTRSAALELGPAGIRVNAVAPGLIWRPGIEEGWPEGVAAWNTAAPLGKLVGPNDIAAAVLFLASDAAASITGTTMTVDCGLSIRPGW